MFDDYSQMDEPLQKTMLLILFFASLIYIIVFRNMFIVVSGDTLDRVINSKEDSLKITRLLIMADYLPFRFDVKNLYYS